MVMMKMKKMPMTVEKVGDCSKANFVNVEGFIYNWIENGPFTLGLGLVGSDLYFRRTTLMPLLTVGPLSPSPKSSTTSPPPTSFKDAVI